MRAFVIVLMLIVRPAPAAPVAAPARMNAFVTQLIRRMTPDEKAGQLAQCLAGSSNDLPSAADTCREEIARGRAGSVLNAFGPRETAAFQKLAVEQTRLKIPVLFAAEITHGYRTIFPIPLGESASWDLGLIESTARVAAREAAANGLHWTFAPMVDVTRDPRWGRVMEGAGEDPWLGARVAAARVRGLQGESKFGDLAHVIATAKHFAGAGAPLAGRDYAGADLSPRELWSTYLPPFAAAIDAGAAAVLASFGTLNGMPAVADRALLSGTLRRDLKFKGLIVSDFGAIPELVRHGVAEDNRHAGQLAFAAGVDVDVQGGVYGASLARDVKAKVSSGAALDAAVRRVLELKYKLGLFTDAFRFSDDARAQSSVFTAEHRALARRSARAAIVLLKNDERVLPLKRAGTIAVVGPLADDKRNVTGPAFARGDYHETTSLLDGIREATRDRAEIIYAKGANLIDDPAMIERLDAAHAELEVDAKPATELIAEAVAAAARADVTIVALGESFVMTGEAASRARLRLPLNQQDLLVALQKTGKPLVLVLSNGRPLALDLERSIAPAILETWFLGTEHGHAVADVVFGDAAPAGRLTMTFPRAEGQVPIYYAQLPSGRPNVPKDRWTSKYVDLGHDPLFPFGFGLTYTKFEYGDVKLSTARARVTETVRARVTVTNVGPRAGEEIVQLYVRDEVAKVSRPGKELRGFEKIALNAGESREVTFTLTPADFQYQDQNLRRISEPGKVRIFIGPNAAEGRDQTLLLIK